MVTDQHVNREEHAANARDRFSKSAQPTRTPVVWLAAASHLPCLLDIPLQRERVLWKRNFRLSSSVNFFSSRRHRAHSTHRAFTPCSNSSQEHLSPDSSLIHEPRFSPAIQWLGIHVLHLWVPVRGSTQCPLFASV